MWFSEAWAVDGKHWHAYASIGDRDEFAAVPISRPGRLELSPDAVLATPDEVADFVASWVSSRSGRPMVYAMAEREWVQVGDAADVERIRGDYALIAARSDSAYVQLALESGREDLYVEAVGDDECVGHDDQPTGDSSGAGSGDPR